MGGGGKLFPSVYLVNQSDHRVSEIFSFQELDPQFGTFRCGSLAGQEFE